MRKKYQSLEEQIDTLPSLKHELILVEGIPGAGKTTTADRIKEKLESLGTEVVVYHEGVSHPADMAWNAYLTMEQYGEYKNKCKTIWENSEKAITLEDLNKLIEKQTRFEDEHAILAYTRIDFPEEKYWESAGSAACYELGDGKSRLEDFTNIHLKRWTRFADEKRHGQVVVFESAFLQNHIAELMGHYQKSDEEIIAYFKNLLRTVQKLNPLLLYLNPVNIEAVISKVAGERKAPEGTSWRDWVDEVIEWVENCNYGKSHNLKGYDGVVAFCEERVRLDYLMINNLEIDTVIVDKK
jgi:hypothetical protein